MSAKIPPVILPTVTSIINWANHDALINDVQFLFGSRSLPYIKAHNCFHYFQKQECGFVLVMVSERDLESFS